MLGQFVAIRMIILKPGQDASAFKDWMIGCHGCLGFLDKMGGLFKKDGLEKIIFLQGNKENGLSASPHPRKSSDTLRNPTQLTAAGANADFAWITQWASKTDNEKVWGESKGNAEWRKVWKDFMDYCFPRSLSVPVGLVPSRPPHGPPYDYRGAPGYVFDDNPTGTSIVHHGRGAGCLVEGFELIYCKSDWCEWPVPESE